MTGKPNFTFAYTDELQHLSLSEKKMNSFPYEHTYMWTQIKRKYLVDSKDAILNSVKNLSWNQYASEDSILMREKDKKKIRWEWMH